MGVVSAPGSLLQELCQQLFLKLLFVGHFLPRMSYIVLRLRESDTLKLCVRFPQANALPSTSKTLYLDGCTSMVEVQCLNLRGRNSEECWLAHNFIQDGGIHILLSCFLLYGQNQRLAEAPLYLPATSLELGSWMSSKTHLQDPFPKITGTLE